MLVLPCNAKSIKNSYQQQYRIYSQSYSSDLFVTLRHSFLIVLHMYPQQKFQIRDNFSQFEQFVSRFINKFEKMTEPRVRKSLTALAGTDERKSYFYCLKMLGVLPPPPKSGFQEWVFYTPPVLYNSTPENQKPLYTPKCLHDVLIASHATTCEHHSFYFAFYHRNLMILTELFLNFAHQVLKGGFPKLKAIYPESDFKFLYNQDNNALWSNVFDAYSKLKGVPQQIANHYWNPTDYLSDADLRLPEEISPQEKPTDPMDLLFFNINKSYPWQVHVPRRWYQQQSEYNYQDIVSNFLHPDPVNYTSEQRNFIAGKLDPRKNPKVYGSNNQFFNKWGQDNSNMVLHRNFLQYKEQEMNYGLSSISPDESQANYGAKSKNTQYITTQQQKANNLTANYCANYNQSIPHYQYARALFSTDIQKFFLDPRVGLERSHDFMHDNFRLMMADGSFSVTSFIFWPYHSWVDAEIQIYIRRANSQGGANSPFETIKKILNNNKNPLPSLLSNFIQKVGKFVDKQQKWNISGKALKSDTVGYYPILQYLSPNVRALQESSFTRLEAAFNTRDLVITEKSIRTTLELNQIYQKYYIADLNPARFYFLNDVRKFNFNYNYQMGSRPSDLDNILDGNASNLPKYLADMYNIWHPSKQARAGAVRSATKVSVANRGKTMTRPGDHIALSNNEDLEVRKLFQNGIHLFASHPSDAQNGSNPVFIKLHSSISKLASQMSQDEIEDLKSYINEGILLENIFIFGKKLAAKECPKCQTNKAYFLDLDENLRERVPKIWKTLHLDSLSKVLFDSADENLKVNCIYDLLELVPNGKFTDYRLVKGAEEIEVEIVGNIASFESQFIRIDAQSYSIEDNTISNILSKKFYTFKAKFDFYKIFDVKNNNEKNHFDKEVYQVVKGWITLGNKKAEFSVDVPCYQRLFRLKVEIIEEQEQLRVIVTDADYDAKIKFYEQVQEE